MIRQYISSIKPLPTSFFQVGVNNSVLPVEFVRRVIHWQRRFPSSSLSKSNCLLLGVAAKVKKGTEMSFRLFHTGKNTSFFPLYYFPRVLHGLLTDLATLSHHHCQVTIGAQAQKRELTLLFKNRFVVPPYHGQFLKLKKKKERNSFGIFVKNTSQVSRNIYCVLIFFLLLLGYLRVYEFLDKIDGGYEILGAFGSTCPAFLTRLLLR